MHDILTLTIEDRTGILLQTKAKSITSFNSKGNFDVLPGHANLIALIERHLFYVDEKDNMQEFKLQSALMKVNSNKVEVFLSI